LREYGHKLPLYSSSSLRTQVSSLFPVDRRRPTFGRCPRAPISSLASQVSSRWTSSPKTSCRLEAVDCRQKCWAVSPLSCSLRPTVSSLPPVTGVRVELTESRGSGHRGGTMRSMVPWSLAAFEVCVTGRRARLPQRAKLQVRESHPAVQAYEARLSTGPPAS
jgi:hypothetical protein